VHISKSTKPKTTLDFMKETQKYLNAIRNVPLESSKSSLPVLSLKNKGRRKAKTKREIRIDTNYEIPEKVDHKKTISPITEINSLNSFAKLPMIPQSKTENLDVYFTRNREKNSNKQKSGYIRGVFEKKPDYIYLSKALEANTNRVYNNFSPRLRNNTNLLRLV
jgi:hypothetical protein